MHTMALDAHPRRCFMCGAKIFECMGFVLARDILLVWQAMLAKRPLPIKVRELCWRCVRVWDGFAERANV